MGDWKFSPKILDCAKIICTICKFRQLTTTLISSVSDLFAFIRQEIPPTSPTVSRMNHICGALHFSLFHNLHNPSPGACPSPHFASVIKNSRSTHAG